MISNKNNVNDRNGLLIIDKPAGWTSHDVVQKVKRLLKAKKVGHTGTLDPDATGVLVLCINRATQMVPSLIGAEKSYQATMCLGRSTDTGDASGKTLESCSVPKISQEAILRVLQDFCGTIRQQVPRYSAVKVRGKPLYRWTRAGQEVERPIREVTIHELELQKWENPFATLLITCSKGTYIRTLAEDIGKCLGLPAHLASLRRLKVGPYDLSQATSIEQLERDIHEGNFDWSKQLYSVEV